MMELMVDGKPFWICLDKICYAYPDNRDNRFVLVYLESAPPFPLPKGEWDKVLDCIKEG